MGASLDGFIAGPGGPIDWSAPDEELHRFHNEQTRGLSGHLLGRRLPCFPPPAERIDLELVETRTFGSRVIYVRYRDDERGCRISRPARR